MLILYFSVWIFITFKALSKNWQQMTPFLLLFVRKWKMMKMCCLLQFRLVFTDRSKAVLLLWIFYVFVLSCVCYVLCASVYMCFVVTCWERADLLALVCGVFCEFVTFPLVSWVRCGTWLYRFLIFAPLLTLTEGNVNWIQKIQLRRYKVRFLVTKQCTNPHYSNTLLRLFGVKNICLV